MTVSSLWKALDRAGCGRSIGAKELQDHHGLLQKTNPWNIREMQRQRLSTRPTLAVDLSIWICEALTSAAMQQHHVADPPLQLVYSRTLKLLNLGIKLVVVVEGKRRIRRADGDESDDRFRKRRSGARFWTACERCETILKALGVPVVRAKAEGEALCALLNQRGVVDGVISNDGDCFLFGAKVLYTKFSIENLEQSKVMRYDAVDIRACLDDDDADKYDETGQKAKDGSNIVKLSRNDLIAFAILTGSDLAGDGLSKVGCRKAIRFIRKCRIDNPLKTDGSPALAELLSWGRLTGQSKNVNDGEHDGEDNEASHFCSCCGHPGNKRSHSKHGCDGCGTNSGEPCFQLSPGGKFRKSLRSKALDMKSKFDPSSTIQLYHQPNENQMPFCLVGKTSSTVEMQSPQLQMLLKSKVIIRGATLYESRQFIQKTLSAYIARTELLHQANRLENEDDSRLPKNPNRPVPKRVTKLFVQNGKQSCEVQWVIKATMTDAEGNPINELEFSTTEEESMIRKTYPRLLENYKEEGKKMKAQGDAEQVKRRDFLASMFADEKCCDAGKTMLDPKDTKRLSGARNGFFGKPFTPLAPGSKPKGRSDDLRTILFDFQQASKTKKKKAEIQEGMSAKLGSGSIQVGVKSDSESASCGDDIAKLNYFKIWGDARNREDDSTIASSTINPAGIDAFKGLSKGSDYNDNFLTPGHIHFLNSRQDPGKKLTSRKREVSFICETEEEQIQFVYPGDQSLEIECTSSLFAKDYEAGFPLECAFGFQNGDRQEKTRESTNGDKCARAAPYCDVMERNTPSTDGILEERVRSTSLTAIDDWYNAIDNDLQHQASDMQFHNNVLTHRKSSSNLLRISSQRRSLSRSPVLKRRKSEWRQKEAASRLLHSGRLPTGAEFEDFDGFDTGYRCLNHFFGNSGNDKDESLDWSSPLGHDTFEFPMQSDFDHSRFMDSEKLLRSQFDNGCVRKHPFSSQSQRFNDIDHRSITAEDDQPFRCNDKSRGCGGGYLPGTEEGYFDARPAAKLFLHTNQNEKGERIGTMFDQSNSCLPHLMDDKYRTYPRQDSRRHGVSFGESQLIDERDQPDAFLGGNFLDYRDDVHISEEDEHKASRGPISTESRAENYYDKELKHRIEKKMAQIKLAAAVHEVYLTFVDKQDFGDC